MSAFWKLPFLFLRYFCPGNDYLALVTGVPPLACLHTHSLCTALYRLPISVDIHLHLVFLPSTKYQCSSWVQDCAHAFTEGCQSAPAHPKHCGLTNFRVYLLCLADILHKSSTFPGRVYREAQGKGLLPFTLSSGTSGCDTDKTGLALGTW